MEGTISAADRYAALEQARSTPLTRARTSSKLTLPWIIPEDGASEDTDFTDPFQNVGAQGVNRLAAKMTLAVMPPNEPFFRHDPDEIRAAEAEEQRAGTTLDAQQKLAQYDRAVMRRIEASGDRPKVELANKHLLIAGNVLLDLRTSTARVIPMDQYVVRRDPRGLVVELVIKEAIHPDTLDASIRAQIEDEKEDASPKAAGEKDNIDVYTHVHLKDGMYEGFQEINGVHLKGTEFKKKQDELALLALRFTAVDGHSWGRGFVESVSGDLQTLETLTQAITDAADMASKVIFMVRSNGTTRVRDVENAANGDVIPGEAGDVTTLQLNKAADLRVARELMNEIRETLKDQFLLRSSATRDAERVTAEEIRYVALEIEDALSGIYSVLTNEFQRPYIRVRIKGMKDLPSFPEDVITVTITTGLEALRRGHEMQKLRQWVEGMAGAYGPEAVAKVIPMNSYGKRLADSLGLDITGLLKDEETANQEAVTKQATEAIAQQAPQIMQGAIQNG
jgi:hypothetical protein